MHGALNEGLSVVIASHADPEGLYLTLFSTLEQLEDSSEPWEIIIAADGGSATKWEKIPNVRCLRIQTGSPQGTRDAGIREAKYPTVLCIEDHVVVWNIYTWLENHRDKKAALSFCTRRGETSELFNINCTETNWDGDLWIKKHFYRDTDDPFRVSQFGNACMMIDRQWYLDSGGYTLEQKGWGGEEQYLCLKAWMLGRECWMFPGCWFAHYLKPGTHKDYKSDPDFIRNMDILRYVITGNVRIPVCGKILPITQHIGSERKKIEAGPFRGDIEKLREYFKKEGIS